MMPRLLPMREGRCIHPPLARSYTVDRACLLTSSFTGLRPDVAYLNRVVQGLLVHCEFLGSMAITLAPSAQSAGPRCR
jgi:hypothetical protein